MFNELETAPCCYDEADHNIMKYLISYFYANFKSLQMVKCKSVCVTSPPGRHGRALVVGDGDPEAVGAGAAGQAAVARVHPVTANQR